MIILLAILGKECSRGRHRENGSECVIFRELCNNEPKIANSMHVWNWEIEIEDTGLLMVVRMLKEEEKEEEKRREEKRRDARCERWEVNKTWSGWGEEGRSGRVATDSGSCEAIATTLRNLLGG